MRALLSILLVVLLAISPALAQLPDPGGIVINTTPVRGGTNGDCLTVSGTVVGQSTCGGAASGITVGTSAITGGTNTRVLYDNAGVLGEYTNTQLTALINPATSSLTGALPAFPGTTTTFFRGDGTYPTLNCAALASVAASCGTDATNASNIGSGTLPTGRLSGSYTGITGLGTLTAGATGAGFTVALTTSTITGLLTGTNGGTGVNNGSSTLTLGASLTTTGVGAPTLAFSGTGRTYTFPDASVTLLSTGGAILNQNPSNPTGTASTAGVMTGLGATTCRVTPLYSTRMSVTVMGVYGNNTNADGIGVSIRIGTGAGPANAAAATGSSISGSATYNPVSAANNLIPFSVSGYATGLTPGTTIWIDLLQAAVTGGTTVIANLTCLANEV